MSHGETECLKACVRALHKTHVRVFTYLSDFEKRSDEEEKMREDRRIKEEAEKLAIEEAREKVMMREKEGLVRM